jgi:hypothetical protein
VLSPFVSFQPYFGQSPRSQETWTVTTVRVGAAIKLGRGHEMVIPAETLVVVDPQIWFSVNAPKAGLNQGILCELYKSTLELCNTSRK